MGNTPGGVGGGGRGLTRVRLHPTRYQLKKKPHSRTDKGGVSDAYFRSGSDDFHGAETLSPTSRHAPNHF